MADTERRADYDSRERIAILETQMHSICEQLKTINASLSSIHDTLSEAKGGWKLLMLVGGASGAIGAFIAKWGSFLDTHPK